MDAHDIKALLGKAGVKQAHLARKLQVTPHMVHSVIFQKSRSRRVARAISRAVGRPISELWPDVYGRNRGAAAR